MRVADQQFYDFNRQTLAKRSAAMAEAQEQSATGRRVMKPSDDPVSISLALKERAREQHMDARERSVDAGRTWLNAQDQALGEFADVLRRAHSYAVEGSNDTYSAADRAGLAAEIAELRDTLLGLANTEAGGRYVFAGFLDDVPPFDPAGVFNGTNDVVELEIADGTRTPAGVTAADAFDAGGADDAFQILADFEVALATNTEADINLAIERIQLAHDRVSIARSRAGALQNAFDIAEIVTDQARDSALEEQETLVGIPAEEAYVKLQQVNTAYTAAVNIAAQLPLPGLAQRG